jgi:hypothetical protein
MYMQGRVCVCTAFAAAQVSTEATTAKLPIKKKKPKQGRAMQRCVAFIISYVRFVIYMPPTIDANTQMKFPVQQPLITRNYGSISKATSTAAACDLKATPEAK